jgi:hypothetical protein
VGHSINDAPMALHRPSSPPSRSRLSFGYRGRVDNVRSDELPVYVASPPGTSVIVKVFGRLHDDPYPRAPRAGVRKAPMDEIARGGATTAQRALRGFERDADADGGGWNVARRDRRGVAGLKPAGSARNPGVLAQILSK